jgi:hypothetical protein
MFRLILTLITISDIFKKGDEEADLLPPPPPFSDTPKNKRELNVDVKKPLPKKEIDSGNADKELQNKRIAQIKEKTWDFLHKTGCVKTKEEKEEFELQRKESKALRDMVKKGLEIEDAENHNNIELKDKNVKGPGEEKTEKERASKKGIFSRKKDDALLTKEVKEAENKSFEEEMRIQETEKAAIPDFEHMGDLGSYEKPIDANGYEEEIRHAIEDAKKQKDNPNILKRLFKGREKPVEENVEMPHLVPKAAWKSDGVEVIEEKMHKARLALMDFNFNEVKQIYIEIMKIYNSLDQKKKAKVYQDIQDLYYERKSAERFAK